MVSMLSHPNESNVMHYRNYTFRENHKVAVRGIKEVIKIIDTQEEKKRTTNKHEEKYDFVDLKFRNDFKKGSMTSQ